MERQANVHSFLYTEATVAGTVWLGKPLLTRNSPNPEVLISSGLANGISPPLASDIQVLAATEALVNEGSCHPNFERHVELKACTYLIIGLQILFTVKEALIPVKGILLPHHTTGLEKEFLHGFSSKGFRNPLYY